MSISINLNSTTDTGGGIDVTAVVKQILDAERGPENLWKAAQSTLNVQTSTWNSIKSNLASLLTNINSLKDLSGALSAKVATSSNSNVVTATATFSAAIANHVVVVNNLATTSSYYTDPVANATTTFANGTFSLQVGSHHYGGRYE
jgi:flagellar hook-associated protein 2